MLQLHRMVFMTSIISTLFISLVALTPLLFITFTSELFELNKMYYIYSVAALCFAALFFVQKRNVVPHLFFIVFACWLFANVISTVFSIDIISSLYGYYGRFNGSLVSVFALVAITISYALMGSSDINKKILSVSVIVAALVVLYGLPGFFGHDLTCLLATGAFNNMCWNSDFKPDVRMFSTLGQPNWLGAYLVANACIALYIVSSNYIKTSKISYIYTFYTILIIIGLFATKSKSAIGAFLALFVITQITQYILYKKLRPLTLVIVIVVLIIMATIKTGITKIDSFTTFSSKKSITNTATTSPQVEKVAPVVSNNFVTDSLDIRKIVWQGAFNVYKAYPLFGTGPETFASSYYRFRPIAHNYTSEWDFLYNKAHNELLHIMATTGSLGIATYLSMIFYTYYLGYSLYKKHKDKTLFVLYILAAYTTLHITNFFGFSTSTVQVLLYLIPAILIVETLTTHVIIKKPNVIIGGAIATFCLYTIGTWFMADTHYARAQSYAANDEYMSALKEYAGALNTYNHPIYIEKLGNYYAQVVAAVDETNIDTQKDLILQSANLMKLSQVYTPYNPNVYKNIVKNNILFYEFTKDISYIETAQQANIIAQKLSTTDPRVPYYMAIGLESKLQNTKSQEDKIIAADEALQEIDKSINLKNDYRDALFLKAKILLHIDKKLEAKTILTSIVEKDSIDSEARELLDSIKD
jgi:putative inorganic carbon (hco3(-)) transporter